jgi:hypothetical protein
VRLSGSLLVVSMLGLVGGAALIGMWVVGLAVMADSMMLGLWVLFRDDGRREQEPSVHEVPTLAQVLERARGSG